MLGRSVDELIGRREQEFTHPDDRQSDVEGRLADPRGRDRHLAVREALPAPGRQRGVGDRQPHNDAQTLASLIGDVMTAQRFGFDAHASVSASVGVATFGPDLETTPDALVVDADSAMYRAKGASPVGQRGGRRRTD